eukprot:1077391-Prymnesium_polylepis.1
MHHRLGTASRKRRSDGQSVRGSGRGAAQLACHQPRVTRGKRVGVENAVPRGRLAAVRGTDGRVGRHLFVRISSGYDLLRVAAPFWQAESQKGR